MNKINKNELIDIMYRFYNEEMRNDDDAKKFKKEIEENLELFMEVVKNELSKGNKIYLRDFGTFEVLERMEKNGRNPKTGESVKIPACKVPKFKPGEDFKNRVNK